MDILLGITIQLDQKRVKFTLPDFQRLFYLCYAVYNLNRTSGWAPQSFTSSRQNRAGARKQSISDFLDEDEKAVCFIFFSLLDLLKLYFELF